MTTSPTPRQLDSQSRTPAIHQRGARAFTLVELLLTISIIAIVLALIFVAIGRLQNQARATACLSNQRQIAESGSLSLRGTLPGRMSFMPLTAAILSAMRCSAQGRPGSLKIEARGRSGRAGAQHQWVAGMAAVAVDAPKRRSM